MPSAAELKRCEEAHEGSAERLLNAYFDSHDKWEMRQERELAARIDQQRHVRNYRYVSGFGGMTLARAALAVCAFAVGRGVPVGQLALVLGPVAGVAGVFVWGYRPSDSESAGLPQLPKSVRRTGKPSGTIPLK